MIYAIASVVFVIWVSLAVWWLYRQGRMAALGEGLAKANIELQRQSKADNKFLKDVDRLAKKKESLKSEADREFARGPRVNVLVRLLNRARGKAVKTNTPT